MTVDGSQKPSDLRRNLTFKAPPLPPTTRSCYLFSASLGALMAPRRLSTTRRLRPRSRHPPLCSQRRHRPPTVVARPPSRPPMSSLPLDRFHAFVDGLVDGASRSCPPRETYLDSSILLLEGRRRSILQRILLSMLRLLPIQVQQILRSSVHAIALIQKLSGLLAPPVAPAAPPPPLRPPLRRASASCHLRR